MDTTPFIDALRHDLATAAAAGGEEAQALADRLTAPLESATRLHLLEVLSAAAQEISLELAPTTVEVRLRGRDPEFVVTTPELGPAEPPGATTAPAVPVDDEGGTARLNLRLPESLKQAIEAAASGEGLSLNAWLVRAASAALATPTAPRPPSTSGQRFTGWAR
ncbi:toxin-antitoxin system HicB family antitoxin [Nitriliruptoraceae bacterium ZYF776]|nr:toxin-antitoxin system HicB family antitoxin [Profundirhabdus halotolerans]